MPLPVAAAAAPTISAGLGAVIGGGLSFLGGERRNAASIATAREQMAFQERMSNTAHQRQIKDMRAAGINPILSAKYGGASSPGGAMANIQDTITPAVNTGLGVLTQTTQVQKITQETKKLAEETMSASIDALIKVSTAAPAIQQKWSESFTAALTADLKGLDIDHKKIYIKTSLAELAVKAREANIANSDLGIIMRKIKEVSQSIGIKGSDFTNLIPTKWLGQAMGGMFKGNK